MNKDIVDIYNLLQEITWYFGNAGFDGNCCEDLSLVEFVALRNAYEQKNISLQEIGKALQFTKSGVTRIIDRLEAKGYLTRERSPIDGRVCCVPLTVRGTEVITRVMDKNTRDLNEILKDLGPEVLDDIKNALQTLVKAVQVQSLDETKNCTGGLSE